MGLLILEREVGEWVRVGDNISVLLKDIRGRKAFLGFDAPREIEIVRDDAATGDSRKRFVMTEGQCHDLKKLLLKTSPCYEINNSDDLHAVLSGVVSSYPE